VDVCMYTYLHMRTYMYIHKYKYIHIYARARFLRWLAQMQRKCVSRAPLGTGTCCANSGSFSLQAAVCVICRGSMMCMA